MADDFVSLVYAHSKKAAHLSECGFSDPLLLEITRLR
jgi:hypothetical protein